MNVHSANFPMNRSFLILLALVSGAAAQESAPLQLTLRDAVSLALKQNPLVILANLGVARSEQERLVARSGLLPQVNANAAEADHRLNVEAMLGISFPGLPQHVGPFQTFQVGGDFEAPVFDLTLWQRYRSARLGVDASRAQELTAREESVLLVVSQYLGSQRAAADVQAAQSQVDLAQALYDQAADLQQHGVGTGIDTLRANVQLQNQKQRLIVARTSLDTSLKPNPDPAVSSGLSSVTPGCKRARLSTLRPFKGILTMRRLVTDWPSVGLTVSTPAACASTNTRSLAVPTSSFKSARNDWLISSGAVSTSSSRKPSCRATIRYLPMGRFKTW